MGLGMSRWNMASCGAFRRNSSELQDPSNYKRFMVDRDNHDNASDVVVNSSSRNITNQPEKDTKDVAVEEKNAYVNNIYQQLDEESEKNTNYDGPMFMKSPSFRDFVRPIERLDSVKNGGKKEGQMRENNKAEPTVPVCNEEVCAKEETKNETPVENKEAGHGKEKRIYKILSQAKPSAVTGGVKSLFHHHPKHSKPSN